MKARPQQHKTRAVYAETRFYGAKLETAERRGSQQNIASLHLAEFAAGN